MRFLWVIPLFLLAFPAMAQSPMNNVSRTITGNAVQSTNEAVGKATSAEATKAEDAKAAETAAGQAKAAATAPSPPPPPPAPK